MSDEKPDWREYAGGLHRIEVPGGWLFCSPGVDGGALAFVPKPAPAPATVPQVVGRAALERAAMAWDGYAPEVWARIGKQERIELLEIMASALRAAGVTVDEAQP